MKQLQVALVYLIISCSFICLHYHEIAKNSFLHGYKKLIKNDIQRS